MTALILALIIVGAILMGFIIYALVHPVRFMVGLLRTVSVIAGLAFLVIGLAFIAPAFSSYHDPGSIAIMIIGFSLAGVCFWSANRLGRTWA